MKFLLDQGLPRSTATHLHAMGLEAQHVGELGLATATDERILNEGRNRNAIVVTLDSDFHALLALTQAPLPSVIRIRIEGLKGEGVARIIQQVVEAIEPELSAGVALTVSHRRMAVRHLPLIAHTREFEDDAKDS